MKNLDRLLLLCSLKLPLVTSRGLNLEPMRAGDSPAATEVMSIITTDAVMVLKFHIGSTEKSVNSVIARRPLMNELL
jgi:hypothetical protein